MSLGLGLSLHLEQRLETRVELSAERLEMMLDLASAVHDECLETAGVCTNCQQKLSKEEILEGFSNDPEDTKTKCPTCSTWFQPELTRRGGRGSISYGYYCAEQTLYALKPEMADMDPQEIRDENPALYYNVLTNFGTFTTAFKHKDIVYKRDNYKNWKDKVRPFLGLVPDQVIADCVGINQKSVWNYRNTLQIGSWQAFSKGKKYVSTRNQNKEEKKEKEAPVSTYVDWVNGTIHEVGKTRDGIKVGEWTTWHKTRIANTNGHSLRSQGLYTDKGKQHGVWRTWHENGQLSSKGYYENGKELRIWIYWYKNGQKRSEGEAHYGKPDGNWTEWHKNGQKKEEGEYRDGKARGKWTFWLETGQIAKECEYRDGEQLRNVVKTTCDKDTKQHKNVPIDILSKPVGYKDKFRLRETIRELEFYYARQVVYKIGGNITRIDLEALLGIGRGNKPHLWIMAKKLRAKLRKKPKYIREQGTERRKRRKRKKTKEKLADCIRERKRKRMEGNDHG